MRREDFASSSLAFALLAQALTLVAFLSFDYSAHGQAPVRLELERTIALPNVSGRIDHLAVDVPHQRFLSRSSEADRSTESISHPARRAALGD